MTPGVWVVRALPLSSAIRSRRTVLRVEEVASLEDSDLGPIVGLRFGGRWLVESHTFSELLDAWQHGRTLGAA